MAIVIENDSFQRNPNLEPHLGGSDGDCWTDLGALTFLKEKFNITSLIDVGTGLGGVVKEARELGLTAVGVDGDWSIEADRFVDDVIIHDYQNEPSIIRYNGIEEFDLGWCIEMLEHLEARYLYNIMKTFRQCKYLIVTHAMPNQGGWHHCNLRDHAYWIDIFTAFGFQIDPETTNEVRNASTMGEKFMRQNSLFFRNLNKESS